MRHLLWWLHGRPDKPVNAVLYRSDVHGGVRVIPLDDLTYRGKDHEGLFVWRTKHCFLEWTDRVEVATMPARSAIYFGGGGC